MKSRRIGSILTTWAGVGLLAFASAPAIAGAHTWDVNEVFSNADGTIQFIELQEMGGGTGENGVGGGFITSNTRSYDIPANVVGSTSFKTILFGTPAFAALFATLPGAPTPDFIFPAGSVPFFSVTADSISYTPYDPGGVMFTAGQLPTDGVNSRYQDGSIAVNTPTNFAGQGGTIDASPPPPGVPNGTAGSTPMTVAKLDASASSISISWDTTTCTGAPDHEILYGERSQLPAVLGGTYGLTGSACALGVSSPYTWNPAPSAADGSGLVWWVIVVKKGSTEGSWGENSLGGERNGAGAGGSSGQCGVTSKNVSNACGH